VNHSVVRLKLAFLDLCQYCMRRLEEGDVRGFAWKKVVLGEKLTTHKNSQKNNSSPQHTSNSSIECQYLQNLLPLIHPN